MKPADVAVNLELCFRMSRDAILESRQELARQMGHASSRDVELRWVALHYGESLAEELRAHLVVGDRERPQ